MFVLGKRFAQLLWLFVMQVDQEARDDFCWLDHATWSRDELTSLIKAHLPLFTKAAVAVSKVQFITHIAAHDGYAYLIFPCCIAATGIQDLDPLKHSAKLIVVRACITDHAPAQGSRDADPEFESAPAQRGEFVHYAGPTHAGLCEQQCGPITSLFNTIAAQRYMCHDDPDTGVCKQDIGAVANDEQRPVLLGTQAHQIKQFFLRFKREPHICGTADPEGSMSCQRFVLTYPLLKVRVEFIIYCLGIKCHGSILSVRRNCREFLAEHRTCRITQPRFCANHLAREALRQERYPLC